MTVNERKELFNQIHALVIQGKNADKMNEQQFRKIVEYGNKIIDEHDCKREVVDLVNSILACFDGKEQYDKE